MTPVSLKAAQRDLFALVRTVERDAERIVLTRRGRPVAALVPFGALAALDLLGRMLPDVAVAAAGLRDPDAEAPGMGPAPAPALPAPNRRSPAPATPGGPDGLEA